MELLILASLILLNGAFAMSEIALLTARKPRLSVLAKRGDTLAATALKLGEQPTRFLSTIQIGITSIGLLNGIYGEAVLAGPLAQWLQGLGFDPYMSSAAATAGVVIAITYVSIVIGELVPKRLGQHNAERIARLVAWPMQWLAVISAPFVQLLSVSTDALLRPLLRLLRIRAQESGPQALSVEEIRAVVLESSNFMPKKHVSILLNLFDLEAITVDHIMVPRARIEALDIEAAPDVLLQQVSTAYHRRLPVYQGAADNIIGVVNVRTVLNTAQEDELTPARLRAIMRAPYFIPSGTPLFTQLQHFQERRDHLGLVVDEYGELMGLVTLEDVLEEMVGEFAPSPLQPSAFYPQDDGSYLVEGTTLLRELNRKLGYRFPLDGPKTLNGLIVEHLGEIPEPDTEVTITGQPMQIVQTQDRAVKVVRLAPLRPGHKPQ